MTKDVMDKYKELEFVTEKLVDYCNNTVGMATACEVIAVEAALERLYKARQKESEKDMTKVNNGGPAFPEAGARGKASGGEGMTLRQYAAIKLKVPNSGTDWLDEMIRESLRVELAAKAMQVSLYKCEYFPDEHWRMGVALDSYAMADAMREMGEMKK